MAEFQLMFNKSVAPEQAFADLKNEISDGNLGGLRVDPASLEQVSRGTEGNFLLPLQVIVINLKLSNDDSSVRCHYFLVRSLRQERENMLLLNFFV